MRRVRGTQERLDKRAGTLETRLQQRINAEEAAARSDPSSTADVNIERLRQRQEQLRRKKGAQPLPRWRRRRGCQLTLLAHWLRTEETEYVLGQQSVAEEARALAAKKEVRGALVAHVARSRADASSVCRFTRLHAQLARAAARALDLRSRPSCGERICL